ncbi:MAG: sigma-70 family RNA polymerase sigma factor [Candidatus Zixiibacteriota bacterium]
MIELWKKASLGDKSAEAMVFKELRVRLSAIARLYVRAEDAEDIAQESCITILQKYKEIGEPYEYDAWAVQVLRNKIRNFQRKESNSRRIFNEYEGTTIARLAKAPENNPMFKRLLLSCLHKLISAYPRYARILNLIHQGYPVDEICMKMKVNRNNLYVILARSRRVLGKCLFGDEEE